MQFRTHYSSTECMDRINQLKNQGSVSDQAKADVQVQDVDGDSFTLGIKGECLGQRMVMLRYNGEVTDSDTGGAEVHGAMELAAALKIRLYGLASVLMIPSVVSMLSGPKSALRVVMVKYHVGSILMLAALAIVGPSLLKMIKNSRKRISDFFETELAAECTKNKA